MHNACRCWIPIGTRLNLQGNAAVDALPLPHIVAGVAAGQARLAECGMPKRKPVILLGVNRLDQAAVNAARAFACFGIRTAGRFTRLSVKLRCAGSCGLSFTESAMPHVARAAPRFPRPDLAVVPCEGALPPRAPPGYLNKEISMCYTARTVQAGKPMTGTEMGAATATRRPLPL